MAATNPRRFDNGTAVPAESAAAIIVAAGRSTRMGGVDKAFAPVAGRPLVWWSLAAFCATPAVRQVALVVRADLVEPAQQLVAGSGWHDRVAICVGGERRQDSVAAGLAAVGGCDWVLVHDGARPCITPAFIAQAIGAARATGAAVPGLPVTDTIKRVGPGERIAATVDRTPLRAVQTPQAFRYAILAAAYAGLTEDVTDDAALVETRGIAVQVFPGLARNIKVTTADDLALAEFYLREQAALLGTSGRP